MYITYPDHALLKWALDHRLTRWTKWLNLVGFSGSDSPAAAGALSQRTDATTSLKASVDREGVHVVVVFESTRGRAGNAAAAIAAATASRGIVTHTGAIDEITAADVAATDALIVGCWTPGRVPFGDEPMRQLADWIEGLAPLDGKPVGLFCTYRFFPHTFADMATRTAETESDLARRLELKGAKVAAKRSIHFRSIGEDSAKLAEGVMQQLHAP